MKLTANEESWFAARLPRCKCGKRMSLAIVGKPYTTYYYYICYECQLRISLLAAGADYGKLSNADKHRVKSFVAIDN